MITPSYSATATERVLPRMALDFTTGVLDPRVTIARALNTATRVNSSGLLEIVNANLPRFDYNPATLAPKGLLIEEARTNIAPYSDQFDNVAWVKTRCSITANATASPDGTTNADKLVEDTTASNSHLVQSATLTVPSLATVTVSIFMKAAERTWGRIGDGGGSGIFAFVNLSTGQFGTIGGGVTNSRIEPFNNGWYRVSITGVMTGVLSQMLIYSATADNTSTYTGNGTSGIFIYGADIQVGAFATSYIPTTTTSVTRNADTVTMTGTNFSDWYNASEGAFISWFDTLSPTAQRYIYSANAGGAIGNSFFQTVLSNTTDSYIFSGGVQQARLLAGTINANVPAKLGLRYANANFAIAANGGGLQTQLSGSLPIGIDRLHIGRSAGNAAFLNGHIAKLFWYTSLTNAELVAFTK
jgi:hypothetical protein